MVVGVLSHGPMRFNALQRNIPGISHRMLTLTLRGLERDGLVKRTAFATIPPRVDYELTEAGHSLTEPLKTLAAWARSHQGGIEAAQRHFDARGDEAEA
jgi:DNA-binding HxlR family transcriptional regulator